ncbi:hypothetical protein [Lacticaseibacillus paracasei]|uniref:Uncharacterized protein n=1 Tax=Lacticaseibacillus paracasei subsp. paracasei Lpp126 TaxID=1256206 RepID=S2RH38_LACPA|nr:hypothetical protein Lpp126_16309 [Lacticaseibacillus paracasei subsp. paracasei Lpp126]
MNTTKLNHVINELAKAQLELETVYELLEASNISARHELLGMIDRHSMTLYNAEMALHKLVATEAAE